MNRSPISVPISCGNAMIPSLTGSAELDNRIAELMNVNSHNSAPSQLLFLSFLLLAGHAFYFTLCDNTLPAAVVDCPDEN